MFDNSIAKNVYWLTTIRVESAADVGRLHGVNERVLVDEYAKTIGFFYQFLSNARRLWPGEQKSVRVFVADSEKH